MLTLLVFLESAIAAISLISYEIRPMHGALFAAVMLAYMRFGKASRGIARGVVGLVWLDVLGGLVWMAVSSTEASELMWLRVANAMLVTTWWLRSARKLSDA